MPKRHEVVFIVLMAVVLAFMMALNDMPRDFNARVARLDATFADQHAKLDHAIALVDRLAESVDALGAPARRTTAADLDERIEALEEENARLTRALYRSRGLARLTAPFAGWPGVVLAGGAYLYSEVLDPGKITWDAPNLGRIDGEVLAMPDTVVPEPW